MTTLQTPATAGTVPVTVDSVGPTNLRVRLYAVQQACRIWIRPTNSRPLTMRGIRYFATDSLDDHCDRWATLREIWPSDWPPCTMKILRRMRWQRLRILGLAVRIKNLADWIDSTERLADVAAVFREVGLEAPTADIKYAVVSPRSELIRFCRQNRSKVESWIVDHKKWKAFTAQLATTGGFTPPVAVDNDPFRVVDSYYPRQLLRGGHVWQFLRDGSL